MMMKSVKFNNQNNSEKNKINQIWFSKNNFDMFCCESNKI